MKERMNNTVNIIGWVYEHELQLKVTGENSKNPGTTYISGTLKVATDDECLNVVPINFTYVTEKTSKGNPNSTFDILKKIIDKQCPTMMSDGKEYAARVSVSGAIDLNEWFDADGKLVSTKRIAGSFVHLNPTNWKENEKERNMFSVDMVINGFTRMEANEERKLPERGVLKGAIFNFRKELLPVEFSVTNPSAMDYFEGCDISAKNPLFTQLRGSVVSQTVVRTITEESAFGDPMVRETRSSYKDYVINWAQSMPYEFDSEDTLLASELAEMIQQREIHKAEIKKRQDEYKASKTVAPAANKGYDF